MTLEWNPPWAISPREAFPQRKRDEERRDRNGKPFLTARQRLIPALIDTKSYLRQGAAPLGQKWFNGSLGYLSLTT
jgi:hypothetical protein